MISYDEGVAKHFQFFTEGRKEQAHRTFLSA